MLVRWWLPGYGPHAIKAKQAKVRAQPEISVRRLGNGADAAFEKALAHLPSRVRVLAYIQRRIQCKGPRPRRQQQAGQQNAYLDCAQTSYCTARRRVSSLSVGVSHRTQMLLSFISPEGPLASLF